ncbi:hypothetical protein C8E03_108160 [Lachnotalea glycerini]|uniref:Uncharacterized protein n=1 Tax=Lachnotalea glycerini TaxID=1763509 RepID=A0A318EPY0_9FIRM|nr:hypothetical protein [Lachnotalea glycerini]PXV88433.1 hypothetical protein C8E03_108160 [Lachnotalea glycerini]
MRRIYKGYTDIKEGLFEEGMHFTTDYFDTIEELIEDDDRVGIFFESQNKLLNDDTVLDLEKIKLLSDEKLQQLLDEYNKDNELGRYHKLTNIDNTCLLLTKSAEEIERYLKSCGIKIEGTGFDFTMRSDRVYSLTDEEDFKVRQYIEKMIKNE